MYDIKAIYETTKAAFQVAGMVVTLALGIWYFIDDEVGDKLRRFVGVEEAVLAIESTNVAVKNVQIQLARVAVEGQRARNDLEEQLARVENRVSGLEPSQRLFIVDELRSRVHSNCPTNGMCRYTLVVRRTALGKTCARPETRRFVIDRFGVTHPVRVPDGADTIYATEEWTHISNDFSLPPEVPPGVAEFYIDLVYRGCDPANTTNEVRARTPRLIFEVEHTDDVVK